MDKKHSTTSSLPHHIGEGLIVAAGGATGAVLRVACTLIFPEQDALVWSILLVNVLGSALLGILSVLTATLWSKRPWVSLFWGTGLLGGFTTFSTVMVAVVAFPASALHQQEVPAELAQDVLLAVCYLLLTMGLSFTATWLGIVGTDRALRYRAAHHGGA